MNIQYLCFFLALYFAVAIGTPVKSTDKLEDVNVVELEEPCVRQGGICMREEDCAVERLVGIRGVLCPQQRHLGVECCYLL